MAFEQRKLDIATVQTRDIFNTYVYETEDTVLTVQAAGYFADSRFALSDPVNWYQGKIQCKCSDGYFEAFVGAGDVLNPIVPIGGDDAKFLGVYADLTALQTAHPTAVSGSTATVTSPDGNLFFYSGGWIDSGTGFLGDMLKAVYDPTFKNASAFSMGNMDETATAKILTDVERSEIAANTLKVSNVDTNLSIGTVTATTVDVNSSDGTNATLPQAVPVTSAGLMSGADKDKLDGIQAGAQVNVPTNLSIGTTTSTTLDINSSTGTNATIPASSATDAGLLTADDQDIYGRKTFQNDRLIIDSPNATGDLEFGWFDDLTPEDPNAYGIRRSDLSGYFTLMPNANFPQLVLGSPTGTGSAFIDATNNRPINLNVLDTGVGTPAQVNIGSGGLELDGSTLVTQVLDEDDFSSNSDAALVTQQSIKAYVDDKREVVAVPTAIALLTDIVYGSGAITITLPASPIKRVTVKNTGASNITIATPGAELIEGAATATLPAGDAYTLGYDGTNWWIL